MEHKKIRCDYLLLTALDDEAAALSSALSQVAPVPPLRVRVRNAPTMQQWFVQQSLGKIEVLTSSLVEMGNDAARDWTRRLLEVTDPSYVGFVGIAGAATNAIEFGDVLIAERIWFYEPAKITDTTEQFRGPIHVGGRLCLDRLKNLDLGVLTKIFPSTTPRRPAVVGTIACGEKVVASEVRRDALTAAGRNVIGFEMEGHSFADEVEKAVGRDRWFMVRGVQDKAVASKSDEHRQRAAKNAAQYTVAFIVDADLCIPSSATPGDSSDSGTSTLRNDVEDLASLRFAKRLAEVDPAAFVDTISGFAPNSMSDIWWTLQAEAYWALGEAQKCRDFATKAVEHAPHSSGMDAGLAKANRLLAWAMWRTGDAKGASKLLRDHIGKVVDLAERGRWADLLASVTRMLGEDTSNALALGWYHQAFSIKDAANDFLGCAMALKQIAFLHAEMSNWAAAYDNFELLVKHASTKQYVGADVSKCYGKLGTIWTDLVQSVGARWTVAQTEIENIRESFSSHRTLPANQELRLTTVALQLLSETRQNEQPKIPDRLTRYYWPAVIGGQAMVLQGKSIDAAVAFVDSSKDQPSFSKRFLIPLLTALDATRSLEPASKAIKVERATRSSVFSPLGEWLDTPRDNLYSAARFLEAIGGLYGAIVCALGDLEPRQRTSMGANASMMLEWAKENPTHLLAGEVTDISEIIRNAVPLRNRAFHAGPGDMPDKFGPELIAYADKVCNRIVLLRKAFWIDADKSLLDLSGIQIVVALAKQDR